MSNEHNTNKNIVYMWCKNRTPSQPLSLEDIDFIYDHWEIFNQKLNDAVKKLKMNNYAKYR